MRARWILLVAAGLALVITTPGCSPPNRKSPQATEPRFTLFALGELRGQVEPCGCTTNPLGDLARTAKLIEDTRAAGPVLVVDAGSTLFTRVPVPDYLAPQERLKADLIVDAWATDLKVAAMGLGPSDLGLGAAAVKPARQAANVPATAGIPLEAPRVVDVGAARVGIFGVVGSGAIPGLEVTDATAAAAKAVAELRGQGAQVVIALAQMTKKEAATLARAVDGIDIIVLGLGLMAPEPDKASREAEDIDGTRLVIPANRGQLLARLDITVRPGGGPLIDAIGPAAATARRAGLEAEIARLDAELAGFAADPGADPGFVAARRKQADDARAELAALAATPLRVPAAGSWFTFEQIAIARALPCDASVQDAKIAFDRAAGQANVANAKGKTAPPPAAGEAGYVGTEECELCHAEATKQWQGTKHAAAWETLEVVGKQFDHDCIACHTTGYDRPGGATMADNERLRDVQCEVCHGPGSKHVDADGVGGIVRKPDEQVCLGCHTKDHSDTFELTAYLRDVTGTGHGADFRKALGAGPTGLELRSAGLAKAGKDLGAGCRK